MNLYLLEYDGHYDEVREAVVSAPTQQAAHELLCIERPLSMQKDWGNPKSFLVLKSYKIIGTNRDTEATIYCVDVHEG